MNYAISYNRGGSHSGFNSSELADNQYSAKVKHSDIALFSCLTQYKAWAKQDNYQTQQQHSSETHRCIKTEVSSKAKKHRRKK